MFERSVTDCYSETVKIGWIEYDTVSALKELDPVSWDIAHGEWILCRIRHKIHYAESEVSDGNTITFDNGSTHYWVSEIDRFIEENSPFGKPVTG